VDGGTRFDVARIIISEVHEQQVVVLGEIDGERNLPVVCGIIEATSMERRLKQVPNPRPLTIDAWANTIAALGGELQDVFLTELRDHTYFARLRIRQRAPLNRLVEIDVRPSDAFTMAIHHRVGIFVKDDVLAEVCG
jgi:bifunctional DNase/RNase